MLNLLWLVPALPFLGFLVLSFGAARLPRRAVAWIGAGSVGLSMLAAFAAAASFLSGPPEGAFVQELWTWIGAAGLSVKAALALDPLSLVMMTVVTFVGFLIHVYSLEYMEGDPSLARFMACLNLFVASMLILVLADNLLLLYLGWEGVGLCSYLLIGFWHRDPANVRCANKAFIVTRVGDTALAVGLFLLFSAFGTLNIRELLEAAPKAWPIGWPLASVAALLILGGAVGKSAQLPLQVWLPDAMAGPTPVSALLHSATMVTAGVYLIARMNGLFALAPAVQHLVAAVGAVTLLLAAFSALTQSDIKRVLAYSSISQIGYMFLALGVGAWSAAVFHFFTHAFFKALLFMAAGAVIHALGEQDMFKMGGLRRRLPAVYWTFLAGAASLAAVPVVTAGFYSKDLILEYAWTSKLGHPALWAAGAAGAFLTSLYTFRMVFLVFFGAPKAGADVHGPGPRMTIPLAILAVLALAAGFLETPGAPVFSALLAPVLPPAATWHDAERTARLLGMGVSALSLAGIVLAYILYVASPSLPRRLASGPLGGALHRFWKAGWGFDAAYDVLLVRPYRWLARANRDDAVGAVYEGLACLNDRAARLTARTQNGLVRWYAVGLAAGAAVVVAIAVFL